MKSLVRQQFVDQTWDAAALDAAARFWLALYGVAANWYGYSPNPRHSLELRLSGFPRTKAEAVATELDRRASASDVPNPVVTLTDPDTVVLSSDMVTAPDTAPPVGLGLPLLAGSQFEGLVAEVRLRVIGRKRWLGHADVTLVIVGEVRGGALLVKGVWRSYQRWDEDGYWASPVDTEGQWLAAFREFRRSGAVPAELAAWLRPLTAGQDYFPRWQARLVNTPFDQPRLLGLLTRIVGLVCVTAALGWLVVYIWPLDQRIGMFPIQALLIPIVPPLMIAATSLLAFLGAEGRLLFSYEAMSQWHAAQHATPARYVILTPEQTAPFADDPALRKHTADVLAEGFVHAGDVANAADPDLGFVYRIFRSRDGVTYLVLLCGRAGCWPAAVSVQAQTFFPGGGRVDSVSGAQFYGYLKYPVGPEVLFRSVTGIADPIQFYEAHAAAAEAFALERGLIPARHERFEDNVRRQESISEEETGYYQDHPYSVWDHLRWYLQWPRKEQRG
jgi:hypothetical protein